MITSGRQTYNRIYAPIALIDLCLQLMHSRHVFGCPRNTWSYTHHMSNMTCTTIYPHHISCVLLTIGCDILISSLWHDMWIFTAPSLCRCKSISSTTVPPVPMILLKKSYNLSESWWVYDVILYTKWYAYLMPLSLLSLGALCINSFWICPTLTIQWNLTGECWYIVWLSGYGWLGKTIFFGRSLCLISYTWHALYIFVIVSLCLGHVSGVTVYRAPLIFYTFYGSGLISVSSVMYWTWHFIYYGIFCRLSIKSMICLWFGICSRCLWSIASCILSVLLHAPYMF